MDCADTAGIRMVAFDGDDARAISQLIILNEIMRRVEWDMKAVNRILPCDYFHMMGGVGTGGIIVILLAVLRLGTEDTIEEFITIWKDVFKDASLERKVRSEKLDAAMRDILRRKGIPETQRMYNMEDNRIGCRGFVCAVPEANLGMCEKFRTYKSPESSLNPTIIEAVRATCAVPALFEPVGIEYAACRVNYVTASYNFNNPTWEMIKEACVCFGGDRPVACVLSLGRARRPAGRILQKEGKTDVSSLIEEITSDVEIVDRDISWRIGTANVYHRLRLDHSDDSDHGNQGLPIPDIVASTNTYLGQPSTIYAVDQHVAASQRLGMATLREIGGMGDTRITSTHGLPLLSAAFVERPALIKQMENCVFGIRGVQRRLILSGLGGIGKTQIVISFLFRYISRFRHILFIDASSMERIENGIISKVKSLGNKYARATAREALEVLSDPDYEITRDWVIVYDNLDNPSLNIAPYFPRCDFGTVIITTRNPDRGRLSPKSHIRLEVMSEDEAADALLRAAVQYPHTPTGEDRRSANSIAKELGYLPVALVQAGYFINVHDCMGDYLRRLIKRRADILSRPAQEQLDDHYHGVYAALEVTWPHLSVRTQQFLSTLAFVNYTGFPLILISRAAENDFLYQPFSYVERDAQFWKTVNLLWDIFRPHYDWDQQDVDDLVVELERYSLVARISTHNVTMLRLHPLVHSWAHDRLSRSEQDIYCSIALRLLICGSSDEDEDIYEFIQPHLSLYSRQLHTLHANDRAGAAIILAREGSTEMAIEIWRDIIREVPEDEKHDIRASEASLQLAKTLRASGNLALASQIEDEMVEFRMQVLGFDNPLTLNAIVQQAHSMIGDGQKRLQDALDFWERHSDDNQERLIQIKEALASQSYGNQLIQLWTEILQLRATHNGPDHWKTLRAMSSLAKSYSSGFYSVTQTLGSSQTSDEVDIINLWESFVAASTRRRGPFHPDTINAIEGLAELYSWQNLYESAVEQYTTVLRLRKETQAFTNADALQTMERLAWIYERQKLYNDAEIQWQEMIIIANDAGLVGQNEPLYYISRLAHKYGRWKWYSKSEEQWRLVLHLEEENNHSRYSQLAFVHLASLYERQKRFVDAESAWKGVIALQYRFIGGGRLYYMCKLAEKYGKWRWYDEAEDLWKSIISDKRSSNSETLKRSTKGLTGVYLKRDKCSKTSAAAKVEEALGDSRTSTRPRSKKALLLASTAREDATLSRVMDQLALAEVPRSQEASVQLLYRLCLA